MEGPAVRRDAALYGGTLRLDGEDLPSLFSKPAQLELFSAALEAASGQV